MTQPSSSLSSPADLVAARREKLRQALLAHGSPVSIASDPANVTYATGYRSVARELYEGHRLVALASPERVLLVAPANDVMAFMREEQLQGCELIAYGTFFMDGTHWRDREVPQPYATIEEAVREAKRRVAAEGAELIPDAAAGPLLEELLYPSAPRMRANSGEKWWTDLRRQKLPPEIDILAHAAHVAELGISAGIGALREGVTEAEIARVVGAEIYRAGGIPKLLSISFGEASASGDVHPSSSIILSPGEMARFDVGCVVSGYWADTARCAVLGEPTGEQLVVYSALLRGQEVELGMVRPGQHVGAAARAAIEAVREAGVPSYRRHHVGHAIGLQVYEAPLVSEDEDSCFAAGMVLCIETPYYRVGWGGLMVEDTVVLEDGGHRTLTQLPKDLAVVPV